MTSTGYAILAGAVFVGLAVGVSIYVAYRRKEPRWMRIRSILSIVATGCATLGGSGLARAHDSGFPFDQVVWSVTLLCMTPVAVLLLIETYLSYHEPSDRWLENLETALDLLFVQQKTVKETAEEMGVSRNYVYGLMCSVEEVRKIVCP